MNRIENPERIETVEVTGSIPVAPINSLVNSISRQT